MTVVVNWDVKQLIKQKLFSQLNASLRFAYVCSGLSKKRSSLLIKQYENYMYQFHNSKKIKIEYFLHSPNINSAAAIWFVQIKSRYFHQSNSSTYI